MEALAPEQHMCPLCREVKEVDGFAARKPGQGWLDRTGQARHSYCRTCEAGRLREWRNRNLEARRAKAREDYARRMEMLRRSPKKMAALRETRRLHAWEDRRRAGEREVPKGGPKAPDSERVPRLPIGPFSEWLAVKYEEYGRNSLLLAGVVGMDSSLVHRYKEGKQDRVSIDTVDKALTREGSTFLFQLYPELYPGLDTMALAEVLADACGPATNDDAWLKPLPGVVA